MYAALAGVGGILGYWVVPSWKGAAIGAALPVAWEAGWWVRRARLRRQTFERASEHAKRLGLPLVVVGAPDRGFTTSQCGDITIDIAPSTACPNFIQADITKRIPLPDNSAVIFVSYVLEYVSDLSAAVNELKRVGGDRVYNLRVEPWTATAYLFQGAKRTLPSNLFPEPIMPPSAFRRETP